jgi:hypothetical protein
MATVRCVTCGGVYDTTLPDGSAYYHACPPRTRLRIRAADGTRQVVDGRVIVETDDDGRGGTVVRLEFDPPLPAGATYLGDVTEERRDKRDETVQRRSDPTPGTIRSPGQGTTPATR